MLGFDFWASFRGQGVYYEPTIYLNGKEIKYTDSIYVSDLLTDYALDFLENGDQDNPFFLYLSHKGVHADFKPARRHLGVYEDEEVAYPPTMFPPGHERSTVTEDEYNYSDVPEWVKKQRYSWHGVDYMYHGQISFEDFYKRYCETLLSVDESIGDVLDYLEEHNLMESTIVIYMGDNGFSFGEHGLIDKRQAYEESMRVPMLAMGGGIPAGSVVEEVIQNVDVGPTVMDFDGVETKDNMDGTSFRQLLYQEKISWKDTMHYEYFLGTTFSANPNSTCGQDVQVQIHSLSWDLGSE